MDLLENPFFKLEATSRDDRRRIMKLADEKALSLDDEECSEARSILTMPRKRIAAEMAWLPGVGPKRASTVIESVKQKPSDVMNLEKLPPLARCNAVAQGLRLYSPKDPNELARWIRCLSSVFSELMPEQLLSEINEDRVIAGFPEVPDAEFMADALTERRNYFRQVLMEALDGLDSEDLVESLTVAIEEITHLGETRAPKLLIELIDAFEVEAQGFLSAEGENIDLLVKKVRESFNGKTNAKHSQALVERLCQTVKNWDVVAQPIQVSLKSQGLSHDESRSVASEVRGLSVELANDHGRLDLAQIITETLQDVFAEVVDVADKATEDAEAIERIIEEAEIEAQEAERNDAQWRRDVTYNTEIGTIFKSKLSISPSGVSWKQQHMNLDDISGVRWGGIQRSSGTTFIIMLTSRGRRPIEIELKNSAIYSKFIECLWKAVGFRILANLLTQLNDGKKVKFGEISVSDVGLEMKQDLTFREGKTFLCPWSDWRTGSRNGSFCISHKTDKKLSRCLSYLEVDNVHILEAAMGVLWKNGGARLSEIFS